MKENLLAALAMLVLAFMSCVLFLTCASGRKPLCSWSLVVAPQTEAIGEAGLAIPDLQRR